MNVRTLTPALRKAAAVHSAQCFAAMENAAKEMMYSAAVMSRVLTARYRSGFENLATWALTCTNSNEILRLEWRPRVVSINEPRCRCADFRAFLRFASDERTVTKLAMPLTSASYEN